jgi:hypothetical protein
MKIMFSPGSETMYNFTKFAIELNEEDESVAPTDSRRRPDQRAMELGKWDDANKIKNKLEDKQRRARRLFEAQTERAINYGIFVCDLTLRLLNLLFFGCRSLSDGIPVKLVRKDQRPLYGCGYSHSARQ